MKRRHEGERMRKESPPGEGKRRDRSNEARRERSRSSSPTGRRDRDRRDQSRSEKRGDRFRSQVQDQRQDRFVGDHSHVRTEHRSREGGRVRGQDQTVNRLEQVNRKHERTRDGKASPKKSDPIPVDPHHRKRRRWERGNEEEDVGRYEFGGGSSQARSNPGAGESTSENIVEAKPNYGLSGKLTAETNTYKGVVIKYNEPTEARIPKTRWRLYGFKGDEALDPLYVHRQSAYLIGRNRTIVDMPVDHPSCSGQHAVLQYRLVNYSKEDGSAGRKVKPYIIDLESTNGTYVNSNRIDNAKYYELKEGDMIKFGFSSREYVLLHEHSKQVVDETAST